jgi:hypothetical protein
MKDFFLLQTISNTGNNWGNPPLYNEENKVLKGLTMKTLVIATIVASVTASASFAQQTPNNYIGTNDQGVISERYGNNANLIITRDMATQNELNTTNRTVDFLTNEVRGRDAATNSRVDDLAVEINRVDREDHRVVNASVNSDGKLVLHSQGRDGNSKRWLTTTAQITGQDGTNGKDGEKGADGTNGKDGEKGANGTNGTNGKDGEKGADGTNGKDGEKGANGTNGKDGEKGANGTNGKDGEKGANGKDGEKGANGTNGKDGKNGKNGKNAIAPLGSLSFAAASASFSGNGIGFGLSASNYSPVEGSIVVGVDLGNNWRAVAGVTTDFNKRHAASVGVGVSF